VRCGGGGGNALSVGRCDDVSVRKSADRGSAGQSPVRKIRCLRVGAGVAVRSAAHNPIRLHQAAQQNGAHRLALQLLCDGGVAQAVQRLLQQAHILAAVDEPLRPHPFSRRVCRLLLGMCGVYGGIVGLRGSG